VHHPGVISVSASIIRVVIKTTKANINSDGKRKYHFTRHLAHPVSIYNLVYDTTQTISDIIMVLLLLLTVSWLKPANDFNSSDLHFVHPQYCAQNWYCGQETTN